MRTKRIKIYRFEELSKEAQYFANENIKRKIPLTSWEYHIHTEMKQKGESLKLNGDFLQDGTLYNQ